MKTWKAVAHTKEEIEKLGYNISNAMCTNAEIYYEPHLGCLQFNMALNCCALFSSYKLGTLVPEIVKQTIGILGIKEDDEYEIPVLSKDFYRQPLRIVSESGFNSKVIGFGHFLYDNHFVLIEDLIKLAKENTKEIIREND